MSKDFETIADFLVPEFLERFAEWNAEYPEERLLGVRAEYVEMHRKIMKLRRPLLDGELVEWRESPRTVLMELIGHAFLALVDLAPEPENMREGSPFLHLPLKLVERPEYPCEGAEEGVCGGSPHTRDCPEWEGERVES